MDTIFLIVLLLIAAGSIAATLRCVANDGYRRVPTAPACRDYEYR